MSSTAASNDTGEHGQTRVATSPHDAFAKFIFRDLGRAREEIGAALGPEVAALIDWSTLQEEPTELLDQTLGRLFPDLRFSATLAGRAVQIDVLFEHQSAADPLMPVRFFCQTGAIWNAARQEGRGRMPLVVNVVLYNGLRPWPKARELWTVIDGGEDLRDRAPWLLPTLPMIVDDLAAVSDAQIEGRRHSPAVELTLLLLKHARRSPGEGVRALREAQTLAAAVPEDVLMQSVRYVCQVDRGASVERVAGALEDVLGRKAEEIAMTVAEQFEAKGEAKGKAIGKAEGFAQALMRVILKRRLPLTAEQRHRIESCREPARLQGWVDAAIDASSVEEILRGDDPPADGPRLPQ